MRESYIKPTLNKYSWFLELIGLSAISLHIWVINGDFSGFPAWLKTHLQGYKELFGGNWPLWAIAIGILIYVLGFVGGRVRSAKDWRVIQYILDKAQEIAYPDQVGNGENKHDHRVTLFRHQQWAVVNHWSKNEYPIWSKVWPWGKMRPWSGWLVPVKRSGHTSKRSKTRFLAMESGESEGICGTAWSSDRTQIVQNLPMLSAKNKHNRRKYSENSNCPIEMVNHIMDNNGASPPCSLGAIPVRVQGRPWGVLVFDSKSPIGVRESIEADFQITVGAIEQLLEKN